MSASIQRYGGEGGEPVRVEIISVGSELLRFGRPDTNSLWLGRRLQGVGIEVAASSRVGDDEEWIASLIRSSVERAEVVLLTGGLGPTEDDRTREGLARAFDLPLERDESQLLRLRGAFEARGSRFTDEQARQAERPRGAEWLENPLGTAPGVLFQTERCLVALLPGVPSEMRAMFEASVLPLLVRRAQPTLAWRVLKIAGRMESSVDRQLRDLYGAPGLAVTLLAGVSGLELLLRAGGSDAACAQDRLEQAERQIRERLGADFFGADDETLPEVVGRLLGAAGLQVGTAESCTAGLLGAALTEVPGSSAWYRGGLVVYSDELKITLAGVAPDDLRLHGAVSEPVARQLAQAARERCAADLGLAITGIAGPSGGGPAKPVGLVHSALADGRATEHWKLLLPGDRQSVRHRAVTQALDRLRRYLLDRPARAAQG